MALTAGLTTLTIDCAKLHDGSVSLRPWKLSDAAWYAECSRDDAIQRFTTDPADLTAAEVATAIRISRDRADRDAFLIGNADGSQRLGNLAVDYQGQVAHISAWVAAAARGHGVAASALKLLLDLLLENTDLREVRVWIHADNVASRRAVERAGFARDPAADRIRTVKGAEWPTVEYCRSLREFRVETTPTPPPPPTADPRPPRSRTP